MYFAARDNEAALKEGEGKVYTLSKGDRGIEETVEVMRGLVYKSDLHPEVKRVAVSAIVGCRPTDFLCYTAQVYAFAKARFLYVPDINNVEEITAPWIHSRRILESGTTYGDCDDFSTTQAAWLRALGVKTRFTVIATPKHNGNFDHVRVEAFIGGRWMPLETTSPKLKFGQKMAEVRSRNFEL